MKKETEQETLEEVAYQRALDRNWSPYSLETRRVANEIIEGVKFGAKWQQERMYTEEEVNQIVLKTVDKHSPIHSQELKMQMSNEWFEQFKKK